MTLNKLLTCGIFAGKIINEIVILKPEGTENVHYYINCTDFSAQAQLPDEVLDLEVYDMFIQHRRLGGNWCICLDGISPLQ